MTNGTISLIEQGRVSPSVGSLKKLLECIPMSLAEFFTFELVESRSVVSRRDEMPNLGNDTLAFHLVGASMKDRNMCILREIYQPQADTRCSCTRARGRVVVSGRLELTVDGATWLLDPETATTSKAVCRTVFAIPART